MSFAFKDMAATDQIAAGKPDVTIVMPCLNELQSLPHCMANALDALSRLRTDLGLSGEILIADNGSTDGSQALATELGGRVVDVLERGYGAALIGGCRAAQGQFIIMGDCDGSYNFTEGVAMVAELQKGADLCMGNRFRGGIAPGAMPWKNRYIGNPALTGILNIFFKTGMRDAHCGLRAIRKNAFDRLNLSGSGMEFASEMVIKAALLKLKMNEVPATLSPDIRNRAPHLRPWRDGWRHLRYLFMLSPKWVFAVPSALAMASATFILATAIMHAFGLVGDVPFGESWIVVGALLLSLGHMAGMMSIASYLHGVRAGYRLPKPWLASFSDALTLEGCVIGGLGLVSVAAVSMLGVVAYWGLDSFSALPTILPVALAGAAATIGFQTLFGGFLFAVIAGNDANFLRAPLDR